MCIYIEDDTSTNWTPSRHLEHIQTALQCKRIRKISNGRAQKEILSGNKKWNQPLELAALFVHLHNYFSFFAPKQVPNSVCINDTNRTQEIYWNFIFITNILNNLSSRARSSHSLTLVHQTLQKFHLWNISLCAQAPSSWSWFNHFTNTSSLSLPPAMHAQNARAQFSSTVFQRRASIRFPPSRKYVYTHLK